jgi:hypothetical protein
MTPLEAEEEMLCSTEEFQDPLLERSLRILPGDLSPPARAVLLPPSANNSSRRDGICSSRCAARKRTRMSTSISCSTKLEGQFGVPKVDLDSASSAAGGRRH